MSSRKSAPSNAFTLLMATSRKRQRASRFVQCPVGCLQHFAEKDINRHIDLCLLQQEKKKQATEQNTMNTNEKCIECDGPVRFSSENGPRTPTTNIHSPEPAVVSSEPVAVVSNEKQFPETNFSKEETLINEMASQPLLPASVSQSQWDDKNDKRDEPFVEKKRTTTESSSQIDLYQEKVLNEPVSMSEEKNAFARMLSQSKVLFSSKERAPREQCFHLHENGCVSVYPTASSYQRAAWQSNITIKDRSLSRDRQPTEFAITLSSALPSHFESSETVPPRWVQRHSRLSVPVLKSILQKSIRRRRPLPSVKVAMELADKSLGELLRRLPIIILEDSTLHPNLDLLVWLMMAHSKDYAIPPSMLARVFQIIFEICMCPWIDSCSSITSAETDKPTGTAGTNDVCTTASLTSLNEELLSSEMTSSSSLVWAILARAEYGGMKGDVDMLRSFATVWKNRFVSDVPCPAVGERWERVPAMIHERARDQAHQLVSELCEKKLRCLTVRDISVQGIDFHCSSIIDHLLSDDPFRELCCDLLKLNGAPDMCHSQLPSMLKKCLWDHSAGINRRQSLEGDRKESSNDLLYLWNELISPRVSAFQTAYVERRLTSS